MQWQFSTSVVSEVSEATAAVECEGEKKLVLFCIFPIVPWDNTIKYELVCFSVLSDYLTWSGALSLRRIGSHRRQGSFQTTQKVVDVLFWHSTFSSLSSCYELDDTSQSSAVHTKIPTLVAEVMMQGATCSSGAMTIHTRSHTDGRATGTIWGSVSSSWTLRHVDCRGRELNLQIGGHPL